MKRWVTPILILWASPAWAEDVRSLSLPEVLKAVEASARQSFRDAATKVSEASLERARSERGIWEAEAEGTFGKDQREATVVISRQLNFGVANGTIEQQVNAEARRESLTAEQDLRDQSLRVAHLYVDLLNDHRRALSARQMEVRLSPLVKATEVASQKGSASALAMTKYRLLKEKAAIHQTFAQRSKVIAASALDAAIGSGSPIDPATASLADIPPPADPRGARDYQCEALRAEVDAHAASATAAEDHFQISTGFGLSRDFAGDATSFVAKVSLPLGQGSRGEVFARAERAAGSAKTARLALIESEFRRRIASLQAEEAAATERTASLAAQRDAIEKLFDRAATGFGQGLTDISELIEILEQLGETDQDWLDAARERDGFRGELFVLTGGSP